MAGHPWTGAKWTGPLERVEQHQNFELPDMQELLAIVEGGRRMSFPSVIMMLA